MENRMREDVLTAVYAEAEHTVEDLKDALSIPDWGLAELVDMNAAIRRALARLDELDSIANAFDDTFERFSNL